MSASQVVSQKPCPLLLPGETPSATHARCCTMQGKALRSCVGSLFQKLFTTRERTCEKTIVLSGYRSCTRCLQGSLKAQGQSGQVPQAWELGWAVSASSQESVPEVSSSQAENHKGHSHGYFKQHICWQNTNVVTQIPSHSLQRHLTAFKIHFSCFAKLHWEIMLFNYNS